MAAQTMAAQLQFGIDLNVEEPFMFIYAMPDMPPEVPVMVAQATGASQNVGKADRVIGICHLAQNPPVPSTTAVNAISPVLEVKDYLEKWEHKITNGDVNARVLQQPSHGLLKDGGDGNFTYVPEIGYLVEDQATVLVEMSGLKIKVIYFFKVLDSLPTTEDEEQLCPTYKWRISQLTDVTNGADIGSKRSLG